MTTCHGLVSQTGCPFHYAVLLAPISRGQRLLDFSYPQQLLYYLIVERCAAIRVNHLGVAEAPEMWKMNDAVSTAVVLAVGSIARTHLL